MFVIFCLIFSASRWSWRSSLTQRLTPSGVPMRSCSTSQILLTVLTLTTAFN